MMYRTNPRPLRASRQISLRISQYLDTTSSTVSPLSRVGEGASMAMEPEVYAGLVECDAVVNAFGD